jgi:hypothetical protein
VVQSIVLEKGLSTQLTTFLVEMLLVPYGKPSMGPLVQWALRLVVLLVESSILQLVLFEQQRIYSKKVDSNRPNVFQKSFSLRYLL